MVSFLSYRGSRPAHFRKDTIALASFDLSGWARCARLDSRHQVLHGFGRFRKTWFGFHGNRILLTPRRTSRTPEATVQIYDRHVLFAHLQSARRAAIHADLTARTPFWSKFGRKPELKTRPGLGC